MTVVTPAQAHKDAVIRVFGTNQAEYFALPASVDANGTIMTEWELSAEDLQTILEGGRIRLWVCYTGVNRGEPLTPIALEVIPA